MSIGKSPPFLLLLRNFTVEFSGRQQTGSVGLIVDVLTFRCAAHAGVLPTAEVTEW
jgi:hypothetical protein